MDKSPRDKTPTDKTQPLIANVTKPQRAKSQRLILDVGVQTLLMYTCTHGGMHTAISHCIYYKQVALLSRMCCCLITGFGIINNTSLTYNKPVEQLSA